MGLYSFYRISKPSEEQVAPEKTDSTYRNLRNKTFWGVTVAYSLYYVCRMSLSVVKQPLIDEGVLSAGELGVIGSALLFVYAVGKFMNGFIADYCNIKRFMATGLFISAIINLLLGVLGVVNDIVGNQWLDAVHGVSSGSDMPLKVVPEIKTRTLLQHLQFHSLYRRVPFLHNNRPNSGGDRMEGRIHSGCHSRCNRLSGSLVDGF